VDGGYVASLAGAVSQRSNLFGACVDEHEHEEENGYKGGRGHENRIIGWSEVEWSGVEWESEDTIQSLSWKTSFASSTFQNSRLFFLSFFLVLYDVRIIGNIANFYLSICF